MDVEKEREGRESDAGRRNPPVAASELPSSGGFLGGLTPDERAVLGGRGAFRTLAPGEVLVEQGGTQDRLYVLLSGLLKVSIRSPFSVVDLGQIAPGETVGEMNVIDPLAASATVRGGPDGAQIWGIEKDALEKFIEDHPKAGVAILRWISKLLTRRVRKASERLIRAAETAYSVYEWD